MRRIGIEGRKPQHQGLAPARSQRQRQIADHRAEGQDLRLQAALRRQRDLVHLSALMGADAAGA